MKTCQICNEMPAMPELIACGRCVDEKNRANEAAYRAACVSSYEIQKERMQQIDRASFVPQNPVERRLHRAALRQKNYGSGLA